MVTFLTYFQTTHTLFSQLLFSIQNLREKNQLYSMVSLLPNLTIT